MIDLQVGPERVLVMAVQTDQYSPEQFQVILDEMTSLTETAGGQVIEVVTQKLPKLDGRTAVGSGKLEEIAALVEAREIDLVISLNALTPSMTISCHGSTAKVNICLAKAVGLEPAVLVKPSWKVIDVIFAVLFTMLRRS